MPKFIAMLRVKDGMQFIHEWLQCFEKLVDEIVVLDNGSTDGTPDVLKAHPKVVDMVFTEGYNEGRDKNMLYQRMRLRKPGWCIWVDVDEIFEPHLTRDHFDRLMQSRLGTKYAFRRFHFIDREHFAGSWFRLNYSAGHDRIMWKENPSGYFEDLIMDSPNVKGVKGMKIPTNFRLKHLGYISKDLVDKKAGIYRAVNAPDKEGNIQTMYLQNERRMKWHDDRNSYRVILLNGLLNCLFARQLCHKAYHKIMNGVRSRFQKSHTTTKLEASGPA